MTAAITSCSREGRVDYATGAVVSRFVYATDSSAPDYMVKAGQSYRLIRDQLGSVRLVVNATSGAIVQQLAYDEFGQTTQDTNPGLQPFAYAGGLIDPDTRLLHFGAREYDPHTGRWTTKDPIGFTSGDTNHYGYTLNDPINNTDPTGLLSLDEALGRASAAAAGELDALTFGISNEIAGVDGTCAGPGYGIAEAITIAGTIWVPGGGQANTTRLGGRALDEAAVTAERRLPWAGHSPYAPQRPLPRYSGGRPKPESPYPHTQLGTRKGRYPQSREFGRRGNPTRDID